MLNAGMIDIPYELQDEVELWARQYDRHAKLHFIPVGGFFCRITLRSDDPRMRAYQEGMVPDPPGEDVWFNEGDGHGGVRCLDIREMGVTGIKAYLEKGNTWSGRGEYDSIVEQQKKVSEANAEAKIRRRAFAKEENRKEQASKRKWRLGEAVVNVITDIGTRMRK
jgi:hypothetical protein